MRAAIYAPKSNDGNSNANKNSVTRQIQRTLTIILTILPLISIAATDNVDHKLAEKCRKRAEEIINRNFAHTGSYAVYSNHYNDKLNKCFALITEVGKGVTTIDLWDLHEMSIYGQLGYKEFGDILYCGVGVHNCKSKEEWNELIKPFMEE